MIATDSVTLLGPALIAGGGALGAVTRYLISSIIDKRFTLLEPGTALPAGTMLVNITGSFVIGFLATSIPLMAAGSAISSQLLRWLLITGFCGGFTTFSTAAVDAVKLARDGNLRSAIGSVFWTLLGAAIAVFVGSLMALVVAN